MQEIKLNDTDKKILNLVQDLDMCTPHLTKLARKSKIPLSTIKSKLEKFQKLGVIKGYGAILNGDKIGKGFVAYKFGGKKFKREDDLDIYGKKLASIPEVQEVRFLVGEWDYITKMRVKDEKEYTKIAPKIAIMLDGCKGVISPKCFKDTHKILVD
jgi:Lrp/AsnC family transcriptional regulator, leucine-responsive regulatory protein